VNQQQGPQNDDRTQMECFVAAGRVSDDDLADAYDEMWMDVPDTPAVELLEGLMALEDQRRDKGETLGLTARRILAEYRSFATADRLTSDVTPEGMQTEAGVSVTLRGITFTEEWVQPDTLVIDPLIKALVSRPVPEQYNALCESIRADGQRDAIHARKCDRKVFDGFTRFDVITSQCLPQIKTRFYDLPADADLTPLTLRMAADRRHLTPWQLIKLAPPLVAEETKRAYARMHAGRRNPVDGGPGGAQTGSVRDIVARRLGLGSGRTLARGLAVLESGDDDLIRRLDAGRLSIADAYSRLDYSQESQSSDTQDTPCTDGGSACDDSSRSRPRRGRSLMALTKRLRRVIAKLLDDLKDIRDDALVRQVRGTHATDLHSEFLDLAIDLHETEEFVFSVLVDMPSASLNLMAAGDEGEVMAAKSRRLQYMLDVVRFGPQQDPASTMTDNLDKEDNVVPEGAIHSPKDLEE